MATTRTRLRKAARPEDKKSRLGIWTTVIVLALVAAYLGILEMSRPHVTGDALRLDAFVDLAERGRLQDARILDVDSYVTGTYLREDDTAAPYNAVYLKDTRERLIEILLENRVPTSIDQQTGKRVANLAAILLPGLALIVLFAYLILSSRRGTGLFKVRSGARKIAPEPGGVTFADVAGQDRAIAELRELRDFLSDPQRYAKLGAQIPKGVLLYGPPGCGKTLLAKALAGEAGANFYSISGSDFVELYAGVGAARVRDLFNVARENTPAVIFIDELDSLGRARVVGSMGASLEQEQTLNQVLAEMDGFSASAGIILLAATNRPDVLDPALLRPGRFDRSIALERPDEAARLAILSVHARNKHLDPDVDLTALARGAVGLTGADLANVMNEGALLAARAGKEVVCQTELEDALNRVLEAPERQRRLSMRDRSIARRSSDDEKVTFADVAGQEAAVEELLEIKDYLAEPEKYAALGASVPKGVLLFGPPGCGKTLMARALAGEANAAFFWVGASEFIEMFVGEGASRVRDVFAEAKQMAPAIVFVDELESLGRSRAGVTGSRGGSTAEQEQALNQFLAEMDGFGGAQGVIVLGATNRPDVLDPALLRPGRFDRTVGLELPNEQGRLQILRLHARGKALAPDVDLARLADRAHGLSGADLANVVNEAALLAVRAAKAAVSQGELDEALRRIIEAPERQRRLSTRARSVGKRFAGAERVTFADVAGVDDAIDELVDVKEYLSDRDRFARMGASPPKGILLAGPPGCGKTLLARALAGEANAAFLSVSATEFVEVWVGEGSARVRDLFSEARMLAPAILFIDEIDALGARVSSPDGSREREQTINQILVELDGFEQRTAVIVMAATNRPDILDPALIRPGRFDRKVEVTVPNREGRRAILELHGRGKTLGDDVDLDAVAGRTQGFSGADLSTILNEAALLATRRGAPRVTMALVDEAIDRAFLGVSSRNHVMSDEERRVVAYHEAGHALVAHRLEGAGPPYKLTIVPRGPTLGHCTLVDSHDRLVQTRSRLLARMAVSLAGWAAEKLVFGETGSGAASDLQYVNDLARRMVCDYGMSEELGPLGLVDRRPDGRGGPPTEAVAAIRGLGIEAHQRALAVLTADRALLDRMVEALLERETLSARELDELLAAAGGGVVSGDGGGGGGGGARPARPRRAPPAPVRPPTADAPVLLRAVNKG